MYLIIIIEQLIQKKVTLLRHKYLLLILKKKGHVCGDEVVTDIDVGGEVHNINKM